MEDDKSKGTTETTVPFSKSLPQTLVTKRNSPKMDRCSRILVAFFAIAFTIAITAYWDLASLRSLQQRKYAPIVQLSGGKVRGRVTGKDSGLFLYQGIRYGRAKRFEKPVAVEPWNGLYDASKWRAACPQFGLPLELNWQKNWSQIEDEDCLFLNVWRPVSEKANRTVMVWVHGGAFEMGSIFTTDFDCQYIAQQTDVVVVSLNYRLGPLGWLHGSADQYPGNWGLHDILLALKWVQENIASFGGNPADVTVFGESAGSMALGAILLLPGIHHQSSSNAPKLFRRIILQSGSPTAVTEPFSEALKKTHNLAVKVNCSVEQGSKVMMDCLKGKSFQELAVPLFNDLARNEYFTPVFGDELLPKSTVELVKTSKVKVDVMFGVMRNEGTAFVKQFAPNTRFNNLTAEVIRTETAKLMDKMRQSEHRLKVADFYTGKLDASPSQDDLRLAISDALGDFLFTCNEILFVQALAANSPDQRYYAFRLMQSPKMGSKRPSEDQSWIGVPHATDNKYLFVVPSRAEEEEKDDGKKKDPEDVADSELSRQMIKAWANFAKTGNPIEMGEGIRWEEAFEDDRKRPVTKFMHLKHGEYRMVQGYFQETCDRFWKPLIFA